MTPSSIAAAGTAAAPGACPLPAVKAHLRAEEETLVLVTGRRANVVLEGRPIEIALWAEG